MEFNVNEIVFWVAPPSESSSLGVGFMVGLAKPCLNPKTGVSMPPDEVNYVGWGYTPRDSCHSEQSEESQFKVSVK